ncbi:MAG: agmatine deiminase family protein [Candidatus Dadabacteria bacterium]|nr:MAG: agmatine deiminase family protein [Candidatus Dadabacteria bacterium]
MNGARPATRLPAEWRRHRATYLAWPKEREIWGKHLEGARREFAEFCRTLATTGGEAVEVLVGDSAMAERVESELGGLAVRAHVAAYADVWLRDTGPLFVHRDGRTVAVAFSFNGWGGKYLYPADLGVAAEIARLAGAELVRTELVCEGGAIETDGEGTCLTTTGCLLNPNRNPGMTPRAVERVLAETLGIARTVWLEGCLLGDHTDGHVDTLARFCGPGRVLCMRARERGDPNRAMLERLIDQVRAARDARGDCLEVIEIPAPGRVCDERGRPLPASYLNFYVANEAVVVPLFGTPYDEEAVAAIGACFQGRAAVGVPCRHVLTGGGAWHCVTKQEPVVPGA